MVTHNDNHRNKMDVKFYCSKHPENELNLSSELSRVGASSAYEVNVKIVVHPCSKCQQEVDRIKNAIGVLMSAKNIDGDK